MPSSPGPLCSSAHATLTRIMQHAVLALTSRCSPASWSDAPRLSNPLPSGFGQCHCCLGCYFVQRCVIQTSSPLQNSTTRSDGSELDTYLSYDNRFMLNEYNSAYDSVQRDLSALLNIKTSLSMPLRPRPQNASRCHASQDTSTFQYSRISVQHCSMFKPNPRDDP
jgi:hypothetical protein